MRPLSSLVLTIFISSSATAAPAWEAEGVWRCRATSQAVCPVDQACEQASLELLLDIDFSTETAWTVSLDDPYERMVSRPISERQYVEGESGNGSVFQLGDSQLGMIFERHPNPHRESDETAFQLVYASPQGRPGIIFGMCVFHPTNDSD